VIATQRRPHDDAVSKYEVAIEYQGEVRHNIIEHRYGDGALVLIEKALVARLSSPPSTHTSEGSPDPTLAAENKS
jgi:hypothetical protein